MWFLCTLKYEIHETKQLLARIWSLCGFIHFFFCNGISFIWSIFPNKIFRIKENRISYFRPHDLLSSFTGVLPTFQQLLAPQKSIPEGVKLRYWPNLEVQTIAREFCLSLFYPYTLFPLFFSLVWFSFLFSSLCTFSF